MSKMIVKLCNFLVCVYVFLSLQTFLLLMGSLSVNKHTKINRIIKIKDIIR